MTNDGSHPSASRPARRSSDGAIPPSQTSRRWGCGLTFSPAKSNRGPWWLHELVVPACSDHGERLVEPGGPLVACHAERLVLGRVGDPQPEGREQPSAGHHRQRRQLLRQHDRVASGEDEDAHPELEPGRATGTVRHRHDRIGRLAADALRQPEAVEPVLLDEVDDLAEGRTVQRGAGAETETDADRHPPIMAVAAAVRSA